MKTKPTTPLTPEQDAAIVERWRTAHLNSIKRIAEEFNCSKHQVNKAINIYLATKIPS
jgi:DNA invertase Pin-like site-specific DNA recombinase